MRPSGLILALMLLVLASLTGAGQPLACDGATAARSPAVQVQGQSGLAEAAAVLSVSHQSAPVAHDHSGPHRHDDSAPDGCCAVCCVAVPHVLAQDSEVFLGHAAVPAFFWVVSETAAQTFVGLPFRPPRLA